MNWTGPLMIKLTGYLLIVSFLYASLFSSIYVISAVVLTRGIVLSNSLLQDFQRDFYFDVGYRNFWQMQKDCITLDEELIYVPRMGECRFRNPEFDTTLHFDETGRQRNQATSLSSKIGIAVLGDSHAMGWGVEDYETFSNIIQGELQKPVYNLAVSSYGTYRELLHFQQSHLITKIDTILIQYCDNDLRENTNIDKENKFSKAMNSYKKSYQEHLKVANWIDTDALSTIAHVISVASLRPLKHFSNQLARIHWRLGQLGTAFEKKDQYNPDFNPHYKELIKVLTKFNSLLGNKRIIVFYINDRGSKLEGFPVGKDKIMRNTEFLELKFDKNEFYVLDGHLNPLGHKTIGKTLARYLEEPYRAGSLR
jgi:lysophospholipase L1-like esterase